MPQLWQTLGNQLYTLIEQAESSVSIDEKGAASAVMNYLTRRQGALMLAMAQLRHPFIPSLLRKGIDINYEAPDWARVSIKFEGIVITSETEPGVNIKYELNAATGSEPIETHEKFPEFGGKPAIKGAKATNEKGAIFDENAKFVGFAVADPETEGQDYYGGDKNRDLAGVKSYIAPAIIYSEIRTYNGTARQGMDYSVPLLGKIDVPPGSSMLPNLPSGMDWLLIGYDASEQGEGIQVKRSWRCSGYRGWNQLLYSTVDIASPI